MESCGPRVNGVRAGNNFEAIFARWNRSCVSLTEQRDAPAVKHFLTKAIRRHGVVERITIDGGQANAAAIASYNVEHGTAIEVRQIRYLNNFVEQDHGAIKRVTWPAGIAK